MDIVLKEVRIRKDLKRFIFLPAKIHAGRENWVPPIWMDEWTYFDPEENDSFSYCDTILLLAWRGDEPVGRIMGIINTRYNKNRGEKTARFHHIYMLWLPVAGGMEHTRGDLFSGGTTTAPSARTGSRARSCGREIPGRWPEA